EVLHLGVHHPLREPLDHLPEQIRARRFQRVLEPRTGNRHNVTYGHFVLLRLVAIRRITRWPPHVTPTRPSRANRSGPSRHPIHHSRGREQPTASSLIPATLRG